MFSLKESALGFPEDRQITPLLTEERPREEAGLRGARAAAQPSPLLSLGWTGRSASSVGEGLARLRRLPGEEHCSPSVVELRGGDVLVLHREDNLVNCLSHRATGSSEEGMGVLGEAARGGGLEQSQEVKMTKSR